MTNNPSRSYEGSSKKVLFVRNCRCLQECNGEGKANLVLCRVGVVLLNCQLGGRGDEGQPGFILVLVKAVLVQQWFESRRPMFFSITPLPQRTGAILRPIGRRSLGGIRSQLSIPSVAAATPEDTQRGCETGRAGFAARGPCAALRARLRSALSRAGSCAAIFPIHRRRQSPVWLVPCAERSKSQSAWGNSASRTPLQTFIAITQD
jgi:hypothetical protein